MTTDLIPSSVYKIKDAIAGYSHYYFFCVEPGAYQCTSSTYSLLQYEGKFVQWVGYGWFFDTHPPQETIITIEECKAHIQDNRNDKICVVLGSHAGYSITQELIQFCHKHKVFSFFLFDHWCNLELHFLDHKNHVLHLPNKIGAVDEVGKTALWDALQPYYPPKNYDRNIVITGQPSIEKSVHQIQQVPQDVIHSFRERIHGNTKELLVYLMEPNCEDFNLEPNDQEYLGYTEYTVLDYILNQEKNGENVLVIKPHPRTTMDTLTTFMQNYPDPTLQDCLVVTDEPLELILAAADTVLGMTTVVLIMALKAGKPVKSIQLNRTERAKKMSNVYFENVLIT